MKDDKKRLEELRLKNQELRKKKEEDERQRRIQEEKMRIDRANKIQTEVITSHKKNVEIDWTW